MHLYAETKTLSAGISAVIKALSAKPALPVLEGIYFEASEKGLLLRCTDLLLQIECTIPASVEEEGEFVLAGRFFSDLVRSLPGDTVELTQHGSTIEIVSGRSNCSVQCIEEDEYPEMPFHDESFRITLPQERLKNMISRTVFSTSQEDSKPILTGVLMELTMDALTFVALDGYRLAMCKAPQTTAAGEKEAIVPAKSLIEIGRFLQDTDDPATLTFTGTHVLLDMEHTRVTARLLDGEFIKYKQILPTDHATRVRINRMEMLDSLNRAMLLAREGNNNLVRLNIADEMIKITANNAKGKINEETSAEINGADIEIAFNARYFVDVLKVLDDEYLYMDMSNNVSPCVIRPIQGDAFYYLVLPVRIFTQQ